MRPGYAVVIEHMGEEILRMDSAMLAGKAELTDDDIAVIRYAGEHLISFAGPERIEGATFVCELPQELGAVTKLSNRGGRIVAETGSGTPFIVPVGK